MFIKTGLKIVCMYNGCENIRRSKNRGPLYGYVHFLGLHFLKCPLLWVQYILDKQRLYSIILRKCVRKILGVV